METFLEITIIVLIVGYITRDKWQWKVEGLIQQIKDKL
jgi:hypothetical protein